jgi:glycine cleavage system H lipoate-binding protein
MRHVADENKRAGESGGSTGGRRGKIVSWKEKLMEKPPWKRPCLHHLKGRIDFRACNLEYRCGKCDFDQYFQDQYTVHTVVHPVIVREIKGLRFPQGFYFHKGHTWVKIEEDSTVRVGIDDFAARLFGPLDRVKAPLMGKKVKQNEGCIYLHRNSHEAEVRSPVGGVVTAINPAVRDDGKILNQDPYAEGWVMTVHAKDLRRDLKDLVIGQETDEFMGAELERLHQAIEEVSGPLAADGGQLGHDVFGNMPQLGWEKLSRMFLQSQP